MLVNRSPMATNRSNMDLPSSLRVARRETPVAEITRKLLEYLFSGAVEPGTKIPSERQLAQALEVGRSSVREAIKSLSVLGLLDVRQGDGTYLSSSGSDLLPQAIEWGLMLGEPRTLDLLEARSEVEIVVTGLAAERADEQGVAQLRERLEAMRRASGVVPQYVDADVAFHLEIAKLSRNEVFANLVTSLRALLGVWSKRVLEHAGETDSSLAMHEPIVEAIAAGDADGARAAMRAHMERANRRLKEARES